MNKLITVITSLTHCLWSIYLLIWYRQIKHIYRWPNLLSYLIIRSRKQKVQLSQLRRSFQEAWHKPRWCLCPPPRPRAQIRLRVCPALEIRDGSIWGRLVSPLVCKQRQWPRHCSFVWSCRWLFSPTFHRYLYPVYVLPALLLEGSVDIHS